MLSQNTTRRMQLALACFLLAAAAALMIWGRGTARMVAMVAIMGSVGLVRTSRPQSSAEVAVAPPKEPIRWHVGALLVAAVICSHWYLNYAARHNYTNALPVYLYAASVGALIWWATGFFSKWSK